MFRQITTTLVAVTGLVSRIALLVLASRRATARQPLGHKPEGIPVGLARVRSAVIGVAVEEADCVWPSTRETRSRRPTRQASDCSTSERPLGDLALWSRLAEPKVHSHSHDVPLIVNLSGHRAGVARIVVVHSRLVLPKIVM